MWIHDQRVHKKRKSVFVKRLKKILKIEKKNRQRQQSFVVLDDLATERVPQIDRSKFSSVAQSIIFQVRQGGGIVQSCCRLQHRDKERARNRPKYFRKRRASDPHCLVSLTLALCWKPVFLAVLLFKDKWLLLLAEPCRHTVNFWQIGNPQTCHFWLTCLQVTARRSWQSGVCCWQEENTQRRTAACKK